MGRLCPPTPFRVHVCLAAGEAGVEFVPTAPEGGPVGRLCPPTPFSVHVCLAAGEAGVEFVQIQK